MKKLLLSATLALGALAFGPMAQADGVSLGISIGVPGIVWGGPAYYAPPPPPPRYYYYQPEPVVVVPQPIYGPAPGIYLGWHDGRHHGRHASRRWDRRWDGHKGNRGYGRDH